VLEHVGGVDHLGVVARKTGEPRYVVDDIDRRLWRDVDIAEARRATYAATKMQALRKILDAALAAQRELHRVNPSMQARAKRAEQSGTQH